jgi:RND family efflux transporter MFP subunit
MNTASFRLRFFVTLVMVLIAGVIGWQLWVYYMDAPWTRDGRVRADTVNLAPDVSGPVVQVFVRDNQVVKAGDKLFEIDPTRFTLALAQAQAQKLKAQAAMQDAQRTAGRYASLSSNAVSSLSRDAAVSAALEAAADYQQAQANESVAQLNLQRSTVRATVNGVVTNFSMQPGDYVSAGTPDLAIVDTDSLYVDGYFEETKLRRIAVGDAATVTLLDGGPAISGHVAGLAAGISDAERTPTPSLLADVNPTFTWVRLAQRVPVRIALDHVPAGTTLVAGMTCTVVIDKR